MSAVTPESAAVPQSGLDRRGLMKNAAQLGAAGLAAGVVLNATAAQAAVPAGAVASGAGEVAAAHEPFVVHVQDAAAGALDFYHGERHYQVTDRELAAAILRHAR